MYANCNHLFQAGEGRFDAALQNAEDAGRPRDYRGR
jgi:hypothetical protein